MGAPEEPDEAQGTGKAGKAKKGPLIEQPSWRRPGLVVTLIATALGAGFVPVAPGTAGTAVAVPLAWGAAHLGQAGYLLVTLAVTAFGIWAADIYEERTGKHDNQQIVIDEVAGYLVTICAVPRGPFNLIVGFGLFRLLDTWKPFPVRWLGDKTPGGLGVVIDDLGAGVYGALILYLLDRFDVVRLLSSSLGAQL
jgi:phosphatidylglycerophosphatase A